MLSFMLSLIVLNQYLRQALLFLPIRVSGEFMTTSPSVALHPVISQVTQRIIERSKHLRSAYLSQLEKMRGRGPRRASLSCANQAHANAAMDSSTKIWLNQAQKPNIGIVTAYNDMLSAHQPYESYPQQIRQTALRFGATAQVAGAVPAMCDGVTQGRPGMELSLFSRDVIAQATAVALSHDAFDATLCLGICDKIVPGLLIGALAFGHLPTIFIPAGPMGSGCPIKKKRQCASGTRKVKPLKKNCLLPRAPLITVQVPVHSTVLRTVIRCCSKPWACIFPAQRLSILMIR